MQGEINGGLKQNPAYGPAVFYFMHTLKDYIICPNCGQPGRLVWVHGHGQCSTCKVNIDECCRGEQARETTNNKTGNKTKNDEK